MAGSFFLNSKTDKFHNLADIEFKSSGFNNPSRSFWNIGAHSYLGAFHYQGYPIDIYKSSEYDLIFEGHIYSKLVQSIDKVVESWISGKQSVATMIMNIRQWCTEIDGDYVMFIHDKKNFRFFCINDILGRLPIYLWQKHGDIAVARDIAFLQKVTEENTLDPMGLVQYLFIGYPLGNRSLFTTVQYLPPASILTVNLSTGMVTTTQYFEHNFEDLHTFNRNSNEWVQDLTDIFLEACRNRLAEENVIALSGGYDSRTVAGGVKKVTNNLHAATFSTGFSQMEAEMQIITRVVDALNLHWDYLSLQKTKPGQIENLLRMKLGLNWIGISKMLGFLDHVSITFGNRAHLFTGDGGDKLLPSLLPIQSLKNTDQLVDYIIKTQSQISIDDIARFTGTSRDLIYQMLYEHISKYPEIDNKNKFIHFLIFERGRKWLYEGEDRNRQFLWSTTPFYSWKFFKKTMGLPQSMKQNYGMYNKFIQNLNQDLALIKRGSENSVTSFYTYSLKQKLATMYKLFPVKFLNFRKYRFRESFSNPYLHLLNFQFSENNELYSHVFSDNLRIDLIEKPENLPSRFLELLATITSLIELLQGEELSINHPNTPKEYL